MSGSTLSNGHHPDGPEESAPESTPPSKTQLTTGTTEERLAAIARAIDEWDWRASDASRHDTETMTAVPPPPPAPPPAPTIVPPPPPFVVSNLVEPDNVPVGVVEYGESTVGAPEPAAAGEPIASAEPEPETVVASTVIAEPTPHTDPPPPPPPAAPTAAAAVAPSADVSTPPAVGEQFFTPQAAPAPERRRRRWWPWLLIFLAILVGAGVGYWQATSHHTTTPPHHVAAVRHQANPTQRATAIASFKAAETTIDVASVALTTGLGAIHSIPTVATLTPVVTPYVTALQKYSTELALIKWPTNATAASQALRVQVSDFTTFFQALQTTPNLGAWLAQLHTDAAAVSTATIALRNQLGIVSG
jgi:hypothetical protein